MPFIIPGFEYDIFVSYRLNENKCDGWVTEFVEKLNQELDATLKDKLSIILTKIHMKGYRKLIMWISPSILNSSH